MMKGTNPVIKRCDGGAKRSSLVQGELAHLEATRGTKKGNTSGVGTTGSHRKNSCWDEMNYSLKIVRQNPNILLLSFLVFAILCGGGLAVVFFLAKSQNDNDEDVALDLAVETGRWFSEQLNKAILPLFSLGQFVYELDSFNALADRVATRPFRDDVITDGVNTHRNVSGICDEPAVYDQFARIAASIKEAADMHGVLLTMQLVPHQVVCMVYPLINREDFDNGMVLDRRTVVGLDLIKYPNRTLYSQSVLSSNDVYIAGPLTLKFTNCIGDCEFSVEKAFIAALPIHSKNHTISILGETYEKWGSLEAMINWNELIQRSDIYDRFAKAGKGFQLTRTDTSIDPETNRENFEVVVLAETVDFNSTHYVKVSTTLDTVNDEWQMTISYEQTSGDWLPYAIASTVVLAFFFATLVFLILLQKQKFIAIQKRYMEDLAQPQKLRLRMFLDAQENVEPTPDMEATILNTKPIADFFPYCTVMMADIAGFTSWSSEREPSQVFQLLQTVFFHFDKICRRRNVFKVENSGDAYLVVAGIPEPQADHAVRMTKFAQECLSKFNSLTAEMEKQLGPETGDLKMRIGVCSGPVIGGVLLGGDSRFHVFGATVNTAMRLEALGEPDRIHLSEKTADLLLEAGKKKWVQARKDKMYIPGVGEIQTYFVTQRKSSAITKKQIEKSSTDTASFCSDLSAGSGDLWEDDVDEENALLPSLTVKGQRLVDWQVESLTGLLKKIVAYRNMGKKKRQDSFSLYFEKGETVLDEFQEIIELPPFDPKKSTITAETLASVQLSPSVTMQLRAFVEEVASLYHDNPFHNFEHANHVTMAVHKLLNRIVTPEEVDYGRKNAKKIAADLHDYTLYVPDVTNLLDRGITSDPLTHFAVVFSALVHDTDHKGVSNPQLSKENPALGEKYRFQSVAEQNSVDVSWDLLLQSKYSDLQKCIFATQEEYCRFRQLVVNTVLATDIFDPELKALRNMRWDRAFHSDDFHRDFDSLSEDATTTAGDTEVMDVPEMEISESFHTTSSASPQDLIASTKKRQQLSSTNRKATIVIEHIIQASDVAHTMQHWNVYKRWNEKLFQEMYLAYRMGRSPKDPSEGWYKGELWFFDNYVIPLAKKLDECGVFGVASDECLFNAIENRREWALKGESVVEEMLKGCHEMGLPQLDSVVEGDEGDEQ